MNWLALSNEDYSGASIAKYMHTAMLPVAELAYRASTLGSAEELVQTRTPKKREMMPKSNQDTGPLQLQIAERAIVEKVVGRRLHAAVKKLLHETWNLRYHPLHCSA